MRGMKSLWIPGMTLDSWGNLSIGSDRKSQPIQPIPPPYFFRPKNPAFWWLFGRLWGGLNPAVYAIPSKLDTLTLSWLNV